MKRTNNNEVAMKLDAILEALTSMDARVSALEKTKVATPKNAPKKKTTTKSAKTTTTKSASTKSAPKTESKTTTKKSSAKKTAPKSAKLDIKDFEPCKYKGTDNYVWNGVRGYKAMRSAYCYAAQTNGQAKNLAEARALGVTIDFDKAWNKSKTEFEKKYKYVKASDR